MLGQATAMLIPFPAAIAANFSQGTLPFAFDQVRSFAGPTVAVLGGRSRRTGVICRGGRAIGGRGLFRFVGMVGRDRILGGGGGGGGVGTGIVHTPGEIRGRGRKSGRCSD